MNDYVKDNSIVIIGPTGVGKSFLSQTLSKKTGLPWIPSDLFRHLPHSDEFPALLNNCQDEQKRKRLNFEIELRKKLPNLPNYLDMGYNLKLSKKINDEYGKIGWHFYQKPFETELLKKIIEHLSFPCILDLGSGMAISLDDEYKKIIESLNEEQLAFYNNFELKRNIGFDKIKNLLSPFKTIIQLTVPQNFNPPEKTKKSQATESLYIKSGQYDQLSNFKFDTDGLVNGEKGNEEVARKLADSIISNLKILQK